MSKEILILCAVILIGVAYYHHIYSSWEYHSPGVLVAAEPVQTRIRKEPFRVQDFKIIPKADFEIRARVLGKKTYTMGIEANLSPIDLALGWGPMSDEAVLKRLKITQSNRWYYIHYSSTPPIPHKQLMRHSGNMHMLPASEEVFKALQAVKPGQVIDLSGYLVNVYRDDGWKWFSSMSRTDTGAQSCEVVWVEEFKVVDL